MRRRAVLSTFVALSSAAVAPLHAQDARARRRYAVLSLVGDRLTIVGYVPSVGKAHDTNQQQVVPVNDTVLDTDALRAAEEGLSRADPGARVSLLFAPSRAAYENHQNLFSANQALLSDDVLGPVRTTGSTHLVLVTKLRAEANVKFGNGTRAASGYLEGIGFYIDRIQETIRGDTREHGVGFLAPYVYVTVSLIDLSSREVVAAERITASHLLSGARSENGANPWDVLTPAEKIDAIRGLIREEVAQAVLKVAAPAR